MSQPQPSPGWYPDPAGSGGVRWWDGVGWTEHVSIPEPEPEPAAVPEPATPSGGELHLLVPRDGQQPAAGLIGDDGLLHPRARDVVFAGAPRGSVTPLSERGHPSLDGLTSARGLQVAGTIAVALLCWYVAITGVLGAGSGIVVGIAIVLGVLMPLGMRAAIQVQVRNEFWRHWCVSRGFEPGATDGSAPILPDVSCSPLMGQEQERFVELVARRELCGRDATVGSLVRLMTPPEDADPRATPELYRSSFVVMELPPIAAARWAGASIRGDHQADRPIVLRTMVGELLQGSGADARAHIGVTPAQDTHLLYRVFDARAHQYLTDHPMDVDIVDSVLVVMRDGAPDEAERLDDLCRDALLLHELLVAEHELAVGEPVIDPTRDGVTHGQQAA